MKLVSFFFLHQDLYQENFINLDENEKKIYEKIINDILELKEKRQNAANKRWQKIKDQTEQTQTEIPKKDIEETEKPQIQVEQTQSEHPKTQKIPNILPISQTNKKNIYQQPITQNIQQKNKVDNFNYLKKGVLRI